MLRESDYPLPAAIYTAYDEAEALVMELDMDDMNPIATQTLVAELGMLKDDSTLADYLGDENYTTAQELAAQLQIPLAMLQQTEPWLAAMTVEVMMMTRVGFDPQKGIESHLMRMAIDDAKEITGLETEREQLEMLDGLPSDTQIAMLMQILQEGGELESMLDELIDAWRHGDTTFMQETMLQDMQDSPELFNTLVASRNRNWLQQIEVLLTDEDDYLIIVGALHLVGDIGMPELLRKRGFDVRQIRQNTD